MKFKIWVRLSHGYRGDEPDFTKAEGQRSRCSVGLLDSLIV